MIAIMNALTDWKDKDKKGKVGTIWLWFGSVLLLLSFLFRDPSWFPNGILYALGALSVGLILSDEKPSIIASLLAVFTVLLAVPFQLPYDTLSITSAVVLAVIMFVGILLLEFEVLKFGGYAGFAKYATMGALSIWALWPALYFYTRFTQDWAIPLETMLYHGGIMVLAGLDLVTLLGALKFNRLKELRVLLVLVAIVGAVLLTGSLGWGLQLSPY